MKQKNKTTHKHNYKIVRDEPYNSYGIEMRFKAYQCLCGNWYVCYEHIFNFIYLPEDLLNKPLDGVNYKFRTK